MTPTGRLTNIAPGKGGIARDPATLASHSFPGNQADMLRRCLDADVKVQTEYGRLRLDVTVRAERVGHRVPTGYIDRHLLLVARALDRNNAALPLSEGPTLPKAAGDLAGQAGWIYARLLVGETGNSPLPFWIPGSEVRDTRLSPGKADRRSFLFSGPVARVEVQLRYRPFWQAVAAARGWTDNDVLVLERMVER
jgi:hypothetical protein